MATFGQLTLTDSGVQAQLNSQSGTPLKFTKIGIGSGEYTGDYATLTSLVKEEVLIDVSELYVSNGVFVVAGVFTNESLENSFDWREIGLYFEDENGDTLLYCYANAGDNSDNIPATSDERYVKTVRIATAVSSSSSVTVDIDSATLATVGQIADLQDKITNIVNGTTSVGNALKANGASLLVNQAANYKQGTDLPSSYPEGRTTFFSYNPTNKFNEAVYGVVDTIRGYSNGCIQFLYPHNVTGTNNKICYRTSHVSSNTWKDWQTLALDSHKHTDLLFEGSASTCTLAKDSGNYDYLLVTYQVQTSMGIAITTHTCMLNVANGSEDISGVNCDNSNSNMFSAYLNLASSTELEILDGAEIDIDSDSTVSVSENVDILIKNVYGLIL